MLCTTTWRIRNALAAATLAVIVFAIIAAVTASAASAAPQITRFDSPNRYEVARAAARAAFFDGSRWTNHTVVIACGSDRAVGQLLAASGLAGAYEAPLLLVRTDTTQSVPRQTVQTLEQMTAGRTRKLAQALIVGNTSCVTNQQAQVVARYAMRVVRIGGGDRFAVAANVAAEIKRQSGTPPFVLIAGAARASQYDQVLSAGSICYANKVPVLLVNGGTVPASTSAALASLGVPGPARYVVGGPATVPDSALPALGGPTRVSTATTRAELAADVARFAVERGWLDRTNVAVVNKSAAMLASGPAMGRLDGPILFTDATGQFAASTTSLLADWQDTTQRLFLFGDETAVATPVDRWRPPVDAVPATGNYVYLASDAGDYIGQGREYLYTVADALINVTATGGRLSVNIDGDEWWNGTFQCPGGYTRLQPGTYTDLERYPFHDPSRGGLSWSGEGRGSNTLTGWFIIDRVTYDAGGTMTSVDLRFEQHSEGSPPALHGAIHWSLAEPTQPPGPTTPIPDDLWKPTGVELPAQGNYVYLDSDEGEYVGAGQAYLYTPADARISVSAQYGHLSLGVEGDESWSGNFQTMVSLSAIEQGYYGGLQQFTYHNGARGGFEWKGEGRSYWTLTGWVAVDDVSYVDGELATLDLRFEQRPTPDGPALHGAIHWRADDTTAPPGPVVPVPDTLWRPSPASLPETGNYVYLDSDEGDATGQGREYLYRPTNTLITVSSQGGHLSVGIDGDEMWNGDFQTMYSLGELELGYYPGLARYPAHNPVVGGLSWSGAGGSPDDVSGWFAIDDVTYTDGALTAIDLRFEQRVAGATPALHGAIHWRADDTTPPAGPTLPIPDTLWRPSAAALPTSGSYVYLDSDPGDYIGLGSEYLYTPSDALLSVSTSGGYLSVRVQGYEEWWGDFQTMSSLTGLQAGYYAGLRRYPFHNPLRGGLDWSGEGRGSNTLTGWFAIDDVTYTDGVLTAIDLRFEQHGEGGAAALHGAIHWTAADTAQPPGPTLPIPETLWQPSAELPATGNYVYLSSDPGDYIGQGREYLYTPANASITATASGGYLSVGVSGSDWWNGYFRTMSSLTDLQVGYYPGVTRWPFHNPAKGGLDWSGMGRGSNTLTGWFVIDDVTYTDGVLTAIDLRFEQHSEGSTPALHGAVHWAQ